MNLAQDDTELGFDFTFTQGGNYSIDVTAQGYGGNNFVGLPTGGSQQTSNTGNVTSNALPTIQVTGVSQGTAAITGNPPAMPSLSAQVNGATQGGTVRWWVDFSYQAQETYQGSTCISANKHYNLGPIDLTPGQTLNITGAIGGVLVGGNVTVSADYITNHTSHLANVTFKVTGEQLSASTVKSHEPRKADGTNRFSTLPWFFWLIAMQESGDRFQQFNSPTHSVVAIRNMPSYGFPDGWGLMKVDRSPSNTGCVTNTPDSTELPAIWNWHKNIDIGGEILAGKETGIDSYITLQMNAFHDYYTQIGQAEPTVAAFKDTAFCTFSIGSNGQVVSPDAGQHSFHDAMWIKRYNGASSTNEYLFWNPTPPGGAPPRLDFHETAAYGNYVHDVCDAFVP